jgi:hypothetical protein
LASDVHSIDAVDVSASAQLRYEAVIDDVAALRGNLKRIAGQHFVLHAILTTNRASTAKIG